VERTQTPNQFHGIHPDNAVIWELVLENVQRVLVIRIPIGRHQHQTIGDVEVRVAGRKALAFMLQVTRHGQFHDAQWPAAAAVLKASGVSVLVDHFGVRDVAVGIRHPGFQSVLELGREGIATVKLSSPFRVSTMLSGYDDLDPYVDELLRAFGVDGCLWGSDWPFINVPRRPIYADVLAPLSRWLPDPGDRARVLVQNPRRLFGIGV